MIWKYEAPHFQSPSLALSALSARHPLLTWTQTQQKEQHQPSKGQDRRPCRRGAHGAKMLQNGWRDDWSRDPGSARQARELRCPCSGRDPQGGQLASRPGRRPSFSSVPPRHTALPVCCKSLRGAAWLKGRGQARCQAQPNQAGRRMLAHSFPHAPR